MRRTLSVVLAVFCCAVPPYAEATPDACNTPEQPITSGKCYKIEIVGASPVSFDEAVRSAIEEAGRTVHHMTGFEVLEQTGYLRDGKVALFEITLRVWFIQ